MSTDHDMVIFQKLDNASRVWLFLDYDGTLDEFAATPDDVNPNPEVIDLLACLERDPRIRISIISGRRLGHLKKLVPVSGILLAGTYGIEMQLPDGGYIERENYSVIRPRLDNLKPRWKELIKGKQGFYLEDKGWSLAIHARYSTPKVADRVLAEARIVAVDVLDSQIFKIIPGHMFLEIGPILANKREAVQFLLDKFPWQSSIPLYLGDDDKDESAFRIIKERGGYGIKIADRSLDTLADWRLESPKAARIFLGRLPTKLGRRESGDINS
jgi:trehalose 6-phosphate phosphatase